MKAAHEKRVATSVLDVVSSSSRRRSVNVLFEMFLLVRLKVAKSRKVLSEQCNLMHIVVFPLQFDASRIKVFVDRYYQRRSGGRSLYDSFRSFFVAFKLARIAHCTTAEVH